MSEGTNGPVDAITFSSTTLKNAQKGKITFENHYENLLIQHRDRTNRSAVYGGTQAFYNLTINIDRPLKTMSCYYYPISTVL